MERSLARMSDEQNASLTQDVETGLRECGIDRKVAFAEVLKFVKFTGMDVGESVGTMVLAAPGPAGAIGLAIRGVFAVGARIS